MPGFLKEILFRILLPVAMLLLQCCSDSEAEIDVPFLEWEGRPVLNMSMRVPLPAGSRSYADGNAFENHVDVENNDYRIYFFDSSNRFISEFNPVFIKSTDGNGYKDYSFTGRTSAVLADHSEFKVIVLANWGRYASDMTAGVTTIDDICNRQDAVFSRLKKFADLTPATSPLIPFYGIYHYSGINLKAGGAIDLPAPVSLMRAMAKVEVILDTGADGTVLEDVELSGYNERGYCGPSGVFSHNDYGEAVDWTYGYLHSLHLLGDRNDTGAGAKKLKFERDGTVGISGSERWICYVPEYRNVDSAGKEFGEDTRSRIKVTYKGRVSGTQYIDFKYYSDPPSYVSSMKKGDFFDIKRNYLYSFRVTKNKERLDVEVDVIPYTSVYLDVDYGLKRDEETGWVVIDKYAPDVYYYDDKNWRYYDSGHNELTRRLEQLDNGLYLYRSPENGRMIYTYDVDTGLHYVDTGRKVRLTSPSQLGFRTTSGGLQIIRTNDYGEAIYFWDPVNNICLDENKSVVPLPCFGYAAYPGKEGYMVTEYTDIGNYRVVYQFSTDKYFRVSADGTLTEMKAFPPK